MDIAGPVYGYCIPFFPESATFQAAIAISTILSSGGQRPQGDVLGGRASEVPEAVHADMAKMAYSTINSRGKGSKHGNWQVGAARYHIQIAPDVGYLTFWCKLRRLTPVPSC